MNSLDKLEEKLNEKYPVEAKNIAVKFPVPKEDIEAFFREIVAPSLEKIKEILKKYNIKSSVIHSKRTARIIVNERVFKFTLYGKKSYDIYSPDIEVFYDLRVQNGIKLKAFIRSCRSKRITVSDGFVA